MASIQVFLPLTMLFTVVLSSPLSYSYIYNTIDGAYISYCSRDSSNVEKYEEVLNEARKCYGEFSKSNESICQSYEANVQRCSQPLVDLFVDCLPEKSKDLPPAVVKVAASVVKTFCTSSGEVLLEVTNECIYEFLDQRNKTVKEECTNTVLKPKVNKIRSKHESPSLSEVCQTLREIGDCWQEYVDQDCESIKARQFFSAFYNAVLAACKK